MAAITKIKLWKDTGFIDGAVEIPAVYSADPTNPDMVLEPDLPISPSKDRFFSEIKVKGYFIELMEMSYLKVTYEFNEPGGSSLPKEFYGWVSDVTISSDGELPMTVISWHIDEWRTWKKNVTFGSGHVKRRPFRDLDSTPIQDYQYRYQRKGSLDINILTGLQNGWVGSQNIWWVIVCFNDSWSIQGYTSLVTWAIPLFADGSAVYARFSGQTPLKSLTWSEISRALLDERLGVPPDAIVGAWLSPTIPFGTDRNVIASGSGTSGDPFVLSSVTQTMIGLPHGGHNADPSAPAEYFVLQIYETKGQSGDLGSLMTSSEDNRIVLVSMDGSKMLEMPYDYSFRYYSVVCYVFANEAYLQISFGPSPSPNALENMVGLCTNIPLPQLPINQNAWLDYTYSGQREYDKENRKLQTQANAWKTSASGAITGGLMGGFGPAGALVGAAAGATTGLMRYGFEEMWLNDKEQSLIDRLKSNQLSALVMSSNAAQPFKDDLGIHLRSLIPDQYSLDQISNTRSQFGVSVDELLPTTDALIKTMSPKGYYNIQNLIITGDIPVSAKKWIRNKFASGVRLI